jgi:hypothetical protein
MKSHMPAGHREKRRLWEEHLQRWKSSGFSQAEFCSKYGLSLKSFGYWKRKLMSSKAAVSLVELPISMSAPVFPLPRPIQLRINEKFRIEIERGFDAETLRRLVEVLDR